MTRPFSIAVYQRVICSCLVVVLLNFLALFETDFEVNGLVAVCLSLAPGWGQVRLCFRVSAVTMAIDHKYSDKVTIYIYIHTFNI